MKKSKTFLYLRIVGGCCLLLLSVLLLLSACGPSGPGTPPQGTPGHNGYSLLSLMNQERSFFLSFFHK